MVKGLYAQTRDVVKGIVKGIVKALSSRLPWSWALRVHNGSTGVENSRFLQWVFHDGFRVMVMYVHSEQLFISRESSSVYPDTVRE